MAEQAFNSESVTDIENEKLWHRFVNTIDLAKEPGAEQIQIEAEPKEMLSLRINGQDPLLVCIPHSGQLVPEAVGRQVNWRHPHKQNLSEGAVGVADLYTDQIYDIGELPCAEISTKVSRMLLDVGRPPKTDKEMKEAKIKNPNMRIGMGGGSPFWSVLLDKSPNFSTPLTEAEQHKLIDDYHNPYHELINAQLGRMVEQNGFALLFDGHSMPGVVEPDHAAAPDYQEGQRIIRKPFCILNNDNKSAPPEVTYAFQKTLGGLLQSEPYDKLGYGADDITVGFPFTGRSHSISSHTSVEGNVWGFGLEIAKYVYMKDETTLEPDNQRIQMLNLLVHECLTKTLDQAKQYFTNKATV